MLFRSLVLGLIVGIVAVVAFNVVIFLFIKLGMSMGAHPALPKIGFEERGIAIFAAIFISLGFPTATIRYSNLRERAHLNKKSEKLLAYVISFVVACFAWALPFYVMHDKEAIVGGIIFGIICAGAASFLLEKIEKFIN
jgi:hypothetical protein